MSQSRKEHVLMPGNIDLYAEVDNPERMAYKLGIQTEQTRKLREKKYGRNR